MDIADLVRHFGGDYQAVLVGDAGERDKQGTKWDEATPWIMSLIALPHISCRLRTFLRLALDSGYVGVFTTEMWGFPESMHAISTLAAPHGKRRDIQRLGVVGQPSITLGKSNFS